HDLDQRTEAVFDGRGNTSELKRQTDFDGFVDVNSQKINMERSAAHRVVHDFMDEDGNSALGQFEGNGAGFAGFLAHAGEFADIDADRTARAAASVDDGRHEAFLAQFFQVFARSAGQSFQGNSHRSPVYILIKIFQVIFRLAFYEIFSDVGLGEPGLL